MYPPHFCMHKKQKIRHIFHRRLQDIMPAVFWLTAIKIYRYQKYQKGIVMAQHNMVHLFGVVQTEPTVRIDDETQKPQEAILYLLVVASSRKYEGSGGNPQPELTPVRIRATLPETVSTVASLHENDVVVLKGVLSTRNVNKQIVCKNCGRPYAVRSKKKESGQENQGEDEGNGMLTYVTPIALDVCRTHLTEEEAQKYLFQVREMSNEVQLIGNLCADPQPWEDGKVTAYQLGVNRKFYQKTDDPSVNADYPFIRSYGLQAENDIEALSKGSLVLVDGFLKMRYFDRQNTCPYCGATRSWTDYCLEVVPYSVEYLLNYKTGKQRLAEKEDAIDKLNEL